jgi:hypothetical protein
VTVSALERLMDETEMSFREWLLQPGLRQGREILDRLERIEEKLDRLLAGEEQGRIVFTIGPVTEQED